MSMIEIKANILRQIDEGILLKRYIQDNVDYLLKMAECIVAALKKGNKVLLFGNGGSAADAQHIACELVGKFYIDRKPIAAIALTTNTSTLTSIANDYSYDKVFARQIRALVKAEDVAIGISTSGESANVILGIEEAKRCGAITMALVGQTGKLKKIADYALSVPSIDTPRIQEIHITVGHILCYIIEDLLANE